MYRSFTVFDDKEKKGEERNDVAIKD